MGISIKIKGSAEESQETFEGYFPPPTWELKETPMQVVMSTINSVIERHPVPKQKTHAPIAEEMQLVREILDWMDATNAKINVHQLHSFTLFKDMFIEAIAKRSKEPNTDLDRALRFCSDEVWQVVQDAEWQSDITPLVIRQNPETTLFSRTVLTGYLHQRICLDVMSKAAHDAKENRSAKPQVTQPELPEDKWLMQYGSRLWSRVHRDQMRLIDAVHQESHTSPDDPQFRFVKLVSGFAYQWADSAFQKLVTSHTFAAALMSTKVDAESIEDLQLQWKAFMVVLPEKLVDHWDRLYFWITGDGGQEPFTYHLLVRAQNHEDGSVLVSGSNVAELFNEAEEIEPVGELSIAPYHQRVVLLAKRLIVGLLLTMQNTNNFKNKEYGGRNAEKGEPRGEPNHRVCMIGRAIKVDCRPAIRKFLVGTDRRGKREVAPPSVQVLVRGHYKRQVLGVGRKQRKVIWIEPYWRGPEDAPILTRPKEFS
jgi:hypothetical protein